ncbi:jg5692, partial [Pararge aegeria aegeria]
MRPCPQHFTIVHMAQVRTAQEVVGYLKNIEQYPQKYIILDCGTEMAREVLVRHARNINLGRDDYHYFMAGLVLDDLLAEKKDEIGLINVYGFTIVDHTRDFVRTFMKTWPHKYIS